MAQHVNVGDRLTTAGDQARDIDQDPPSAMDGGEPRRTVVADRAPVDPTWSGSNRVVTFPA